MEGETSSYIQQLGDMKTQLREHAEKLVLVEQEQDKRQRILKQQEYVLLYVCRFVLNYVPLLDVFWRSWSPLRDCM